jgi:hypothetical protein
MQWFTGQFEVLEIFLRHYRITLYEWMRRDKTYAWNRNYRVEYNL